LLYKELKRKISVTTGTRAEYGIIRPVLETISKSKRLDLYLIVTGMHLSRKYGMTINEIKKDGFPIYATFNMLSKDDSSFSMSKNLGKAVISFSKIFHKLKPDINLILGDRDEMLSSALAAYHLNIPNAHIHGGDRSQGGIDEYNRHAITKISNIHFAATKISKDRIIRMGEDPKFVFFTGSPSIDEIVADKISNKNELEKKYKLKISGDEILLLQHPVTTQIGLTSRHIHNTINALLKLRKRTIAIAPNSDPGYKVIFEQLKKIANKNEFIRLYESIPRKDFLGMLKNFGVLLGNSSSGMIEASYFNIPVVNIGIRQKGRERGLNVIDVDNSSQSIFTGVRKVLKGKKRSGINKRIYGKGDSSVKIVKHLERIKLDSEMIKKQITC